jgi:hypothetical protein
MRHSICRPAKTAAILAVLIAVVSACATASGSGSESLTESSGVTFAGPNYQISGPTGWTAVRGASQQNVIFAPGDPNTSNVLEVVDAVPVAINNVSPEVCWLMYERTILPSRFPNYQGLKSTKTTLGGRSAICVLGTSQQDPNSTKYTLSVVCEMRNCQLYVIACACPDTQYDSLQPTFEKSVSSFRFTN